MPTLATAAMDDFDALFARAENTLHADMQLAATRRASWSPLPQSDVTPPVLLVEPPASPVRGRRGSSLLQTSGDKRSVRRASFNDMADCRRSDANANLLGPVPSINIAGSASSHSSRESLAGGDDPQGGLLLQVPDQWTPSPRKKRGQRPKSLKLRREVERDGARERQALRRGSCTTPEQAMARLDQLKTWQKEYDIMPVRQFESSSKGKLINRGDKVRRKSFDVTGSFLNGLETAGVAADGQTTGGAAAAANGTDTPKSTRSSRASSRGSVMSSTSSPPSPPIIHKALVLGDSGVGKTAVVHQFLTSEYMGGTDNMADLGEKQETTVSVLLDDQETAMDIIEASCDEDFRDYQDVDAYVIVYDLTSAETFRSATKMVQEVKDYDKGRQTAIILVGNKSDVVRGRTVARDDGMALASKIQGKYIEVSAVLNHNIDELLVGVAKQIRLNPERWEHRNMKGRHRALPAKLLGKVFKKFSINKTCDNLMVA